LDVLNDAFEKMELFLGHRVRVVNQQRALQETVDEIRERCIEQNYSDEVLVIIDCKMKMELVYVREK
ncbi:hypothetical protein PHYSODRAFT_457107, partial [Phytophthora sojae]